MDDLEDLDPFDPLNQHSDSTSINAFTYAQMFFHVFRIIVLVFIVYYICKYCTLIITLSSIKTSSYHH